MGLNILVALYEDINSYPPTCNFINCLAKGQNHVYVEYRDRGLHNKLNKSNYIAMNHYRYNNGLIGLLSFFRKILNNVKVKDFDIAVAFDMHAFCVIWFVRLFNKKKWPIVYHNHDIAIFREQTFGGKLVKLFEVFFARFADAVVIPEIQRISYFKNKLHVNRNRIFIIPNYATLDFSGVVPKPINIPDKYVIYQGGIGPKKSLFNIVESMPQWPKDLHFLCIGPGDFAFRESLIRAAKRLNVSDRLIVLPRVDYHELRGYTQNAILGFALYEGNEIKRDHLSTASNKIFEYPASGIPVMINRTPEAENFFKNYPWIFYIDSGDYKNISHLLNSYINDDAKIKLIKAAALSDFKEKLNYESFSYPEYLNLILSLLKNASLKY